MSHKLSRPSWKQCALLLILLSHAVFGSPIVPAPASAYETLSPVSQADTLSTSNLQASLEEDVFGPTHDERSERKKRLLYETLKKAKQAKLLSLGAASSNAAKSIGKSVFKTVATLGIKAIIFNFLYSTKVKLALLKKVLKKVSNPLNAILFYHAGTVIAAHFTSTVPPHYVYQAAPSPPGYSIDDATQDSDQSSALAKNDGNLDGEDAPTSNAKDDLPAEEETSTMAAQDEHTSTGYDNANSDDQRDRYMGQNNFNYYQSTSFESHQSMGRRPEYPVHDESRYSGPQSGQQLHQQPQPQPHQQQYYYTYEQARSLPPPFGYEIGY